VLLSFRFEHPEPKAQGKQRHPSGKVQHQPGHPPIERSPSMKKAQVDALKITCGRAPQHRSCVGKLGGSMSTPLHKQLTTTSKFNGYIEGFMQRCRFRRALSRHANPSRLSRLGCAIGRVLQKTRLKCSRECGHTPPKALDEIW